MAIFTQKCEYNTSKMDPTGHLDFSITFKLCLIVLILPLLVYYTLLLSASMVMGYFVHPIDRDKIICFSLLVCWALSGLSTSLASFILIIKFRKATIIFSLASLAATLLFEYSLTLYGKYNICMLQVMRVLSQSLFVH